MTHFEAILTGCSVTVVCIYHLHLYFKVRRTPATTAVGMTNLLRQRWVETVMTDRQHVLAVQTCVIG